MSTNRRELEYIIKDHHPLLYTIAQKGEWVTEDEFPAAREWADEHEKWLGFIDKKGEL